MSTMAARVAERWKRGKPIVMALGIGLIMGPFISNSPGWQVTSGSAHAQARAGVVEQQDLFCGQKARADVANAGMLDWTARSELAKKWSVTPGAPSTDSDVTSGCAGKLAA
jgi:hypothetical protein